MLIFGRDPLKVLAFVSAALQLASALFLHWDDAQQGAVNAVLSAVIGLVGAWAVSQEKALPFITGLCQAVIACALAFGAHLTGELQSSIMTFVAVGAAMWMRTQVVAKVDASGVKVA